MRKHVKPAHPQAAIPDPTRGGDLPPEGCTVEWSVHWARLAQRGDIVVKDVDESDAPVSTKKPAAKPAKAKSKAAPTKRQTPPPAPAAPAGDAPSETGPQVDEGKTVSPEAPIAPEPSIS